VVFKNDGGKAVGGRFISIRRTPVVLPIWWRGMCRLRLYQYLRLGLGALRIWASIVGVGGYVVHACDRRMNPKAKSLKVDQKLPVRAGSHEAKQWVKHENLVPAVFCFPPLERIEVKKKFCEAGSRPCHKWRLVSADYGASPITALYEKSRDCELMRPNSMNLVMITTCTPYSVRLLRPSKDIFVYGRFLRASDRYILCLFLNLPGDDREFLVLLGLRGGPKEGSW